MNHVRLPIVFAVSTLFLIAFAPALSAAEKKAKPKVVPKQSTTKPKPKPPPNQIHNPVPTSARSTLHTVHHHYYAGRAPRSATWYRHHRRHGWVYEVTFRSRAWHERAFVSYRAAHTFMVHLRRHHFERRLHHPSEGIWMVSYRSRHGHRFGTYASLPVAQRVKFGLRESGFFAWLRWHRRYF